MKNIFVALVSVIGFSNAENLANIGGSNDLTGDFMTGFESGIFLRQAEDQYQEYGCPKASIDHADF